MPSTRVVALAGGVGGAKLADGLAQVLQPDRLTVIVNTGDDFVHLGLKISPDLDTVCYTLAGLENPGTGWGLEGDTWNVLSRLKQMGLPDWFQIGDTDLATHITRTARLAEGWTLSQVTQDLCKTWGISVEVLPMSDNIIQTQVYTNEGVLEFQEYFVHRRCQPRVTGFQFTGAENSKPAPGILESIEAADVVVFCPSNPWVSIDPILSIPEIRGAIKDHPVLAVSPLIGNRAIKGPAAKMFSELGIKPSAYAVARHYSDLINCIIIDNEDAELVQSINALGIQAFVTDILMCDRADRARLAGEVINYYFKMEQGI